jgi:putative phage-type endonuclease
MSARQDWLDARKAGIGGSDVAGILGLSKWKTPYSVWLDKTGQAADTEDNEAMKWGRLLEAPIRQEYAERTGRVVLMPDEMLRHPRHDFMLANLDGMTDDGRVVEIKTARAATGWGEAGSDQVPQDYMFQVQHYMAVTGFKVADIAVLIGGSDFRLYEVPADAELQDMMIDAEADFWRRVQENDPPEPVSYADALARWGRASRADRAMADADALAAIDQLRAIKAKMLALERDEEQARAVIMRTMGECDTLVASDGRPLATWKAQAGANRFDATTFKVQYPELHAKFIKQGEPTRRFLLKA